MGLKSVFHMGARDTFSLAFRKGEGTNDLKTLEGKTILLGSAAWQSIVDPMLGRAGRRYHHREVCRGRLADLGHGAEGRGSGRCRAQPGKVCGPSGSARNMDFEYWLGVQKSPLFANTFVVRAADLEDPDKKAFLDKYLRGWAMGLEFAYHNPRAAWRRCSSSSRRWPVEPIGPELGTMSMLQQIERVPWRHGQAAGLGLARHGAWQTVLRQGPRDSARSRRHQGRRRGAPTTCIAAANDFDHAQGQGRRRRLHTERTVRRSTSQK